MSGALTLNGVRVISGSVTIPFYGAWVADVVLADPMVLTTDATLVAGDLTLKGTVVRQASFAASRSARVIGGAGGWRKELPAKGYAHIVGVRLASILKDAASECGETINLASDRSVGIHYAREAAKAERVLNLELNSQWWIDNDGVTQTKDRAADAVVTPFTVLSWSGAKGQFEIASESIAAWIPGRTFNAPTIGVQQTVSSVTIEVDNEGTLRLHIMSTDGAKERLRVSLRALVRQEIAALSYFGTWEYTIAPNPLAPGLVSTVDCSPTDSRMPPLTNVPLVGMGTVSAPVTGTKCRIQFVNGDPTRPECVSLEGVSEHLMTAEATALLIYNVLQTLTLVNPAAFIGLTLQPLLTPAILTAMAAQAVPAPPGVIAQVAAAAAQSAAIVAGTAPANTVGPFAAPLAALAAKIPDVSGLFPSLGVPNGG